MFPEQSQSNLDTSEPYSRLLATTAFSRGALVDM